MIERRMKQIWMRIEQKIKITKNDEPVISRNIIPAVLEGEDLKLGLGGCDRYERQVDLKKMMCTKGLCRIDIGVVDLRRTSKMSNMHAKEDLLISFR